MPENTDEAIREATEKITQETEKTGGKESDSPTGEDAKAGKEKSVPAADDKKSTPDDETKETDEDLGYIEKDGVRYYKSFDKHPEWQPLREAKATLTSILDDHGYASVEELQDDLESGLQLSDLLGTKDAKAVESLVEKARRMDLTEEYWAEQEAKKKEEGETLEETTERLKKELKAEKEARLKDQSTREELESNKRALSAFNNEIETAVDAVDSVPDSAKGMLKMFLGLDNPMDEVDITDRKAVRTALKEGLGKFGDFLKSVEEAAVQRYVDGKEDPPAKIPAGSGDLDVTTVKKRTIPKDATMEEAFAAKNEELIEIITQMVESGD